MSFRRVAILIALSCWIAGFNARPAFAFCEAFGRRGNLTHFACSAYHTPVADVGALARLCCHCPNVLDYLKSQGIPHDCPGRSPPKAPAASLKNKPYLETFKVPIEVSPLKPHLNLRMGRTDFTIRRSVVAPKVILPPRCSCPRGFSEKKNSLGKAYCSSERTVEPIARPVRAAFVQGDYDGSYYRDTKYLDHRRTTEAFSALPTGDGVQLKTASKNLKVVERQFDVERWRNRSLAKTMLIKGPEVDTWYTKVACIKSEKLRDYVVHLSADNEWSLKIDGVKIGSCNSSCFLDGWFVDIKLDEGEHWVEFKFRNLDDGSPGMMLLDVFENKIEQLEKVTDFSKLKTVYSTGNPKNRFFDYEGDICPDGYAYDPCRSQRCRKTVNVACKYR